MTSRDNHTLHPDQIVHWIGAYGEAWRDKDADKVANLFTPDAIYQSHPTGAAHRGRTAIREYWVGATANQTELDLRFGEPLIDGNRAAVEWWAAMRDADWGAQRQDDSGTLPGCLVLRFVPDGLCEELREYWNIDLGRRLLPPPGWGS